MTQYDPSAVEQKWQAKWLEEKVYEVDLKEAKNPYYSHVMFPYPSGDKLHVGHWYNFGPADSFARFMRMQGKEVFTPMGFDAFGLPAENYAVKTGVHPMESIKENTTTMTKQLSRIGCMYDWNRSVNTSQPEYYQWTQWLFLQMYKQDLAYKKVATVNFCDGKCKTVLANEQVWEGRCERCDTEVVQKPLNQWYWKTTEHAQRLLDNLEDLDWPEKTKIMQRNWIGRSEGMNFRSKVKGMDIAFDIWDSVPQTYCAQTFAVIAPEHPLLPEIIKGVENEQEILDFVEDVKRRKATKRFNIEEDMEGIFTGKYLEFVTGDLPLWVASFVVADYGSGVVQCSAHDERDFIFAKKYDIPLRPVMFPEDPEHAERVRNKEEYFGKDPDGIMEQPEEFKGRKWGEVRSDIIDHIEKIGFGTRGIQYRLRDWCISRQRYWGAPIPIVYDPDGNPHPIPEEHLPWELPTDVDFIPTGEAPLAQSEELKKRTEEIFGEGWTPEVDTMDTFVCSSFYSNMYLGADWSSGEYKQNSVAAGEAMLDAEVEKKWMPVDMYIGGAEHACMHLIYARFVQMALKDGGFAEHEEPYQRLVHQGVITNGGAKMSKSKGNVVSPDEFVDTYGSDTFRMYLMFMGPFTQGGDWSDTGIKGVDRFVKRIWRTFEEKISKDALDSQEATAKLHATIKKVTNDIDRLHFNTALSALMELINLLDKQEAISVETAQVFAKLFAPMAPHLAEELWELAEGSGFVIEQDWPTYDESLLVTDTITVVVQVNGKVRADLEVDADISEEDVISLAKEDRRVQKYIEGQDLKKEIYVKGKLVSLVV